MPAFNRAHEKLASKQPQQAELHNSHYQNKIKVGKK